MTAKRSYLVRTKKLAATPSRKPESLLGHAISTLSGKFSIPEKPAMRLGQTRGFALANRKLEREISFALESVCTSRALAST